MAVQHGSCDHSESYDRYGQVQQAESQQSSTQVRCQYRLCCPALCCAVVLLTTLVQVPGIRAAAVPMQPTVQQGLCTDVRNTGGRVASIVLNSVPVQCCLLPTVLRGKYVNACSLGVLCPHASGCTHVPTPPHVCDDSVLCKKWPQLGYRQARRQCCAALCCPMLRCCPATHAPAWSRRPSRQSHIAQSAPPQVASIWLGMCSGAAGWCHGAAGVAEAGGHGTMWAARGDKRWAVEACACSRLLLCN